MATYWPPKRATAFIMYIALESVASAGTFQANPTLAAGDCKVSKDGGALANLSTLPTVTPASGKMVKVSLDSTEMTADNVTIVCSDAAGSEWKDLVINLATVANQNDDMMTAAAGTTLQADTDDIQARLPAALVSGRIDASVGAMAANVVTATAIATDAIGAAEIAADAIAEIQSSLGTSANQTTMIAALTTIAGYIDTEVAAIKAKTDNLPSDPADASDIAAALATIAGYIDTEVAAIKAKTDNLPASPAATSDIPSAATIVAAIFAHAIATGKTFDQASLDIWSVVAGNATANSATNPTSMIYETPDGTTQLTHVLSDTTREVA